MQASAAPVQPVILGADIGVYALARAFHAQYAVKSIVVSGAVLGPIANSKIIDNRVVADGHDPRQLVDELLAVADQHAGAPLLLLANSDWLVRQVVEHRDELAPHYHLPFLSSELLDLLSDKASFTEVARRHGIPVPGTVVQDFGVPATQWVRADVPFDFPVIAKAASSADYQEVEFPGKAKVFEIGSQAELDDLWARLRAAGYAGKFVVQDLIPGDDTGMRSITAYVDSHGKATLLCSAHVLLEEHTPSGLGNPAAMFTTEIPQILEPARRMLEAIGYRGFANFDVKLDPRDGQYRFFEVNPRIGRNNYYVTAAGANPARFVVEDLVNRQAVEPVTVTNQVLYSIVPVRLLLRYIVDPQLRSTVSSLARSGHVARPLWYRADRSFKRGRYVGLALINQVRKFRRHYPQVSTTGF
ncbi:D-aspartate ligase [Rarobacter incanus]|uniref:D-aspartate ligase n=2 Tax=Rarobacter incanus TaxID=153494 RepID=A0A542SLQ5_9MICO|nr:D-aspartate ligase [Rarobacter incanus]